MPSAAFSWKLQRADPLSEGLVSGVGDRVLQLEQLFQPTGNLNGVISPPLLRSVLSSVEGAGFGRYTLTRST